MQKVPCTYTHTNNRKSKHTYACTDTERDRQRDTDTQTDRQIRRQEDRDRETEREDGETVRQTDRQTGRQAGRQAAKQTNNHPLCLLIRGVALPCGFRKGLQEMAGGRKSIGLKA